MGSGDVVIHLYERPVFKQSGVIVDYSAASQKGSFFIWVKEIIVWKGCQLLQFWCHAIVHVEYKVALSSGVKKAIEIHM